MSSIRELFMALAANTPRPEKVRIEDGGFDVYLRRISAKERGSYEASLLKTHITGDAVVDPRGLATAQARFLSLTICDESGKREYGDSKEDLEAIGALPSKLVDLLFTRAQAINAMERDAVDKAKKNSEEV